MRMSQTEATKIAGVLRDLLSGWPTPENVRYADALAELLEAHAEGRSKGATAERTDRGAPRPAAQPPRAAPPPLGAAAFRRPRDANGGMP